jgi:Zn-dependent M16 (insulinase) family peptidase
MMSISQDFLLGQQHWKYMEGFFLMTNRKVYSLNTFLNFHTEDTLIVSASTLDHGFCFLFQLLLFYSSPGSGFSVFS